MFAICQFLGGPILHDTRTWRGDDFLADPSEAPLRPRRSSNLRRVGTDCSTVSNELGILKVVGNAWIPLNDATLDSILLDHTN